MKRIAPVLLLLTGTILAGSAHAGAPILLPGNLVVSVEGNGVQGATSGPYADNQAAPLTLFQFSHTGTSSASYVNAVVLPQTATGANHAISGEYGSSSEGGLQLTADGKHLIIMGYGVNAAAFNANPTAFGTTTTGSSKSTALGQSSSIACGAGCTAVPRVVAVVNADGTVDTTTALSGVFNGNNPRSVASVNGSSFYVSGQGTGSDATGGVFLAQRGATTATEITGLDATGSTVSQDTRFVVIHNGQLYVSVDSKGGSNAARSFIGTVGNGLPTGLTNPTGAGPDPDSTNGPIMLQGFGNSPGGTGKLTLTADQTNGVNKVGKQINLSPEDYFFANDDTLYVADSGDGKQTSASNSLGDGGLQKWSLIGGVWTLDYTLADGLNLVANTASSGTTGLLGLTGEVIGDEVELFATNFTAGDTDPTFLYGITDDLDSLTRPVDSHGNQTEIFTQLAAAPVDSNFKGVSFAPSAGVPEPATWALMISGFSLVGGLLRRRARSALA
ncbi:MAG TPA: PEPxxWA-CTERM sorting domain-containing protein [Phenylobacterium sp.]|jgi:hypothetical protein|uniref:PEPxxWA-CTERM sorting domain-containing protein n=1 Tax=Phenylobacterium sp. TaxID=1871053 RepID=UPI002D3576A2|nr:PEPxxWA-CTERM sorting domain-containing protein [Phenylobacterium sp.]HZZ67280.1 PEPxxWA-CTERM sorting domain-containing protein [Phenylobacterium sp.]